MNKNNKKDNNKKVIVYLEGLENSKIFNKKNFGRATIIFDKYLDEQYGILKNKTNNSHNIKYEETPFSKKNHIFNKKKFLKKPKYFFECSESELRNTKVLFLQNGKYRADLRKSILNGLKNSNNSEVYIKAEDINFYSYKEENRARADELNDELHNNRYINRNNVIPQPQEEGCCWYKPWTWFNCCNRQPSNVLNQERGIEGNEIQF